MALVKINKLVLLICYCINMSWTLSIRVRFS